MYSRQLLFKFNLFRPLPMYKKLLFNMNKLDTPLITVYCYSVLVILFIFNTSGIFMLAGHQKMFLIIRLSNLPIKRGFIRYGIYFLISK
jgi:hypothetical protein